MENGRNKRISNVILANSYSRDLNVVREPGRLSALTGEIHNYLVLVSQTFAKHLYSAIRIFFVELNINNKKSILGLGHGGDR